MLCCAVAVFCTESEMSRGRSKLEWMMTRHQRQILRQERPMRNARYHVVSCPWCSHGCCCCFKYHFPPDFLNGQSSPILINYRILPADGITPVKLHHMLLSPVHKISIRTRTIVIVSRNHYSHSHSSWQKTTRKSTLQLRPAELNPRAICLRHGMHEIHLPQGESPVRGRPCQRSAKN